MVGFLFFAKSVREDICNQVANHIEYAGHALSGIAAHLLPTEPACDPHSMKRYCSLTLQAALGVPADLSRLLALQTSRNNAAGVLQLSHAVKMQFESEAVASFPSTHAPA